MECVRGHSKDFHEVLSRGQQMALRSKGGARTAQKMTLFFVQALREPSVVGLAGCKYYQVEDRSV